MGADEPYSQLLAPLLARGGAYARSILRNRHDAEDAVQQAALRGLERFESFDRSRPFTGWWFAVLRNCCVDAYRRRKAQRLGSLDDLDVPDESGCEVVDWERLGNAMDRLSTEHDEILRLRYFGDLSYRELAETLSIPVGTVMSRLHLARKALAATVLKEAQ